MMDCMSGQGAVNLQGLRRTGHWQKGGAGPERGIADVK